MRRKLSFNCSVVISTMVNKCCVPGCVGNYTDKNKAHIFTFPCDEEVRAKWLAAIKRENFIPTKHSVVCHLHFSESDILWETSAVDWKTGVTVTSPLSKPKLRRTAVPCKLPNCPSYLSKTAPINRESPLEKQQKREAAALKAAIDSSLKSMDDYNKKIHFSSFHELTKKIECVKCSDKWSVAVKNSYILFFYFDIEKTRHDVLYIVINANLSVSVFVKGQEISSKNIAKTVSTIPDIEKIVEFAEGFVHSQEESRLYDIILELLGNLECEGRTKTSLEFIKNKLELSFSPPKKHRFAPHVLIFASLLFFISSHAYKFIRSSGNIILPHPNTIRNICGNIDVNPSSSNFLAYIKEKVSSLKSQECFVTLMLDEIHIKSAMDYKGGNLVGMAHDSTALATTAHVFMVQGVMSPFKDVVHILPVNKMTAESLHSVIKDVLMGLENLGLRVICITSDNNSINRKAVSHFAAPPQLSIAYQHPADHYRPLFYVIDTVHIFKCIRNNWVNLKNDFMTFFFPSFENSSATMQASFSAIRSLFEIESNKLLKFGYGLSLKALWPSSLEKQNVKLVCQIFNENIQSSLLELGPTFSIENYEGTAEFINIISTWWQIVNVKTPFKGLRLRDVMLKPLTKHPEDERCMFLEKFLNWLDKWESMNLPFGKLTKETHCALKHSTYALLELRNYCVSELQMSYVLPGKFQTDALEARFGLYRRLSGSQYHVSIRQIFEAEKKLRLSSLLELTLQSGSTKKILIRSLPTCDQSEGLTTVTDSLVPNILNKISVSQDDLEYVTPELPVLTFIAGYCCYSVLKKLKCTNCAEFLTMDRELACGAEHRLIKTLDRGSLQYPQKITLSVVMYSFCWMRKLLSDDYCESFLRLQNQRQVASKLILDFILTNDDFLLEVCDIHSPTEIWRSIVCTSVNILLNNFCKMENDKVQRPLNKRKLKTVAGGHTLNTEIKKRCP